MKAAPGWTRARQVRQLVQVVFFALFIILLFIGLQRQTIPPLTDFFFRFNPLSALASMLASRAWIPRLGWAAITIGLTIFLGRVLCGWICPFGTLLEWVSFRQARQRAKTIPAGWRKVKFIILVMILVAALLGNLTLLIFEPLAFFTRFTTTAAIPGVNYAVNALEGALYALPVMRPAVSQVEALLRGPVLPVIQPIFTASVVISVMFFSVLGLNLLADRFWCRYLCPLGGLLGWISKISIFRPRITQACTGCTRCALVCKPGAIKTLSSTSNTSREVEITSSECTMCLDCLAACNKGGMIVTPSLNLASGQPFDLKRRQLLQSITASAAGVVILNSSMQARIKNSRLIRPPGVVDEAVFLSRCLRCGECLKVCPTNGLQTAVDEAGVAGWLTPVLIPRIGHCDYGCNACGQACPSGAIPALFLEQKRQAVIGAAVVDRNRCLPWASDTPCIVCEEMCPTPQKSIRVEEVQVTAADGQSVTLQRPVVLRDLCIGCGICENHCPLEGSAAIQVYSRA